MDVGRSTRAGISLEQRLHAVLEAIGSSCAAEEVTLHLLTEGQSFCHAVLPAFGAESVELVWHTAADASPPDAPAQHVRTRLAFQGQEVAEVVARWPDMRPVAAEDLQQFQVLASRFASACAELRRRALSALRLREASIVAQTAGRIAAAADLPGVLHALMNGVQALTGAEVGGVRLLDDAQNADSPARLYFWRGDDRFDERLLPAAVGTSTTRVLQSGKAEYTRDLFQLVAAGDASAAVAYHRDGICSSLILPLRASGRVVGSLHADARRPNAFREDQLLPLQMLADNAGGAVEQARLRAAETAQLQARLAAEETLRESEARYRSLVELSPDLIAVHSEGVIRYLNPAGARLCGASTPQDLIGRPMHDLLMRSDGTHPVSGSPVKPLDSTTPQSFEGILLQASGDATPVEVTSMPLTFDGAPALLTIARDVTERKALEARLTYQAFHDPLTGLPNRARFADRLDHALARAARKPASLAVLYLDLDRFKTVNDTLGHAAGDELLIAVSRRLAGCVRQGDTLARRGGDEFAVLIEDTTGLAGAVRAAERLLRAFDQPFFLEGHVVNVTASIGIVQGRRERSRSDDIMRDADVAMYKAKASGRNRYAVFKAGMQAEAQAQLNLESELRQAIAEGQVQLSYQPIVDLATSHLVGVEAFVRWRHATRGLLLPEEFLPPTEDTGAHALLNDWLVREACEQLVLWRDGFPEAAPLALHVTLTRGQLQATSLDDMLHTLQRVHIDPQRLVLQFAEADAAAVPEEVVAALRRLKERGVQLCLTDLWVGAASRSFLKQLAVEYLKVTCTSAPEQAALSEADAAATAAVVALAHALGLRVIAQGIAAPAQVSHLAALGCDLGQGVLLGTLQPAEAVTRRLAQSAVGAHWQQEFLSA